MTESDFDRWLQAYGSAWESRDPEAAVGLFTSDALYYETPFDEPARGSEGIRMYWAESTGRQRGVGFRGQVLAVSGLRGLARWSAEFVRIPSGARVELDGILQVDFAPGGRCRELREWWHMVESPPS